MKNRLFYCRCAMLLALLSLLSLLQFSCDLEESCLDPNADCFVAGNPLFVSSVPAAPGPVNADFNKVRITFSKKISRITNITNKKAYSLSGSGAAGFSIDKIDLVDDTTIEVKLKGDISEGPIQLDFSKLKGRNEKTLKGTTSISFTSNYKAIVTMKSGNTKTTTVTPTGGNAITITSSLDTTIAPGASSTTITRAGTNAIKVEIESSSSYTVNVSTGAGGSASVTYPTTTTTAASLNNFVTPPPIFPGTATATAATTTTDSTTTTTTDSTNTFNATTGRFTTTTGKITITTTGGSITTTGGSITTTGGSITTNPVKFKWSTILDRPAYHMGKGTACPLKAAVALNRTQAGTRFQEGWPPSVRNNNTNVEKQGTESTTFAANTEIETTINPQNLSTGVTNLIICVQKPGALKKYASKTFKVYKSAASHGG